MQEQHTQIDGQLAAGRTRLPKAPGLGLVALGLVSLGLSAAACSNSTDTNVEETAPPATPPVETTLYQRLGEAEGITSAVSEVVQDAAMDEEVLEFFLPNVPDENGEVPDGKPTLAQIEACLVLQLSAAAGGPEVYPGEAAGWQCRTMADSHAGLGISEEIFDRFVASAAGTLARLGVPEEDVAIVGGVLNSTKDDIVENQ